MARWARRPPSQKRVVLVLGAIAIALAIWGVERLFGTPDWMRLDGAPAGRVNR